MVKNFEMVDTFFFFNYKVLLRSNEPITLYRFHIYNKMI